MAQINVSNLTFGYEGSYDNIFENVSFSIDTNWKLGFIGRNGKGKTTFLNLLLGKYEYQGSITKTAVFDYFPYRVNDAKDLDKTADELMEKWKPQVENWRVLCELGQLEIDAELLYRPFGTLSFGERTKVMLAVLFSGENDFLLIDEPTNHLDQNAREIIKKYLASKKGFILVSHDMDLLDACVDHVLVLNRSSIEVQSGNFTSWWENKEKADNFAKAENEKHIKEIGKLKAAADRSARWADKNESTKIGYDPVKENDRSISTRAYLREKLKDYADWHNIDYTMLLSILRSLDMERVQFEKDIEDFSEGQKKKVLIAASLLTPAHIYIWDEPLNYIDVFSRMQIETLIERFKPTMLVVEHDVRFMEKLATRVVEL